MKRKTSPKKKKTAKAKAPAKMGRPTSFSESLAGRILELAKSGATDNEIAAKVGISPTTLNNWKGKRPDFKQALKDAKSVADDLVEASLFRNACGYTHPAMKFFFDAKSGKVISQAYVEHHKPDTTAQIFWLKNRRKDEWRDSHKHEHSGKDGAPIETRVISVVEVQGAIQEALQDAGHVPPTEDF
jgi:DNA-binding XRE family transcriptional regulator